jgi:hypothetical protein
LLANAEAQVRRIGPMLSQATAAAKVAQTQLELEQADVESWSGSGLKVILWRVIGRLDDRQHTEGEQLVDAATDYAEKQSAADALVAEYERLVAQQRRFQLLAGGLDGARTRAQSAVIAARPDLVDAMASTGQRATEARALETEIDEAHTACRSALDAAQLASNQFRKAQSLGTYDLLGGGIIASAAKRNRVEGGLHHLDTMHRAIDRLRCEVADLPQNVLVPAGLETLSSPWTFDVWFDNLFSDWAMQNRIKDTAKKVNDARASLSKLESSLAAQLTAARSEASKAARELDKLVLSAVPVGD